MSHDLQPRDYVYWKRYHLKDFLQAKWKDSYQVLLTSSCAGKLKEIDSWIHISHLKRASASDWSVESTADIKLTFKQLLGNKETPM